MSPEKSSALTLGGLLVAACFAASLLTHGLHGLNFKNEPDQEAKNSRSSTIRSRTQILSPTQSIYPTFRDQMKLKSQEMGLPTSNPEALSEKLQVEAQQMDINQLAELRNISLDTTAETDLRFLAVYYLTYAKPEALPLLQTIATAENSLLNQKLQASEKPHETHMSTESFQVQNETALRMMALAGIEKHILNSAGQAQVPRNFVDRLPSPYLKKIGNLLLQSQSTGQAMIDAMISQTLDSEIL